MTPIVERSEALSLLVEAAQAVRKTQTGQIVLASGEAGIGKTRLINDFASGLGSGRQYGRASCDHLYTQRTFGPWLDLAEMLGKAFARSINLAVESRDPIGRAGQAVLQLPAGTVLVLEDIHDADAETLDLLRFLFRRLAGAPIMLVCSYRPEEVGTDHPLISVLGDLPANISTRFELPPLTRAEVTVLCQESGLPADPIYRLSGGNPFFATELLRKAYQDGQPIPDAFRHLAATRLQRLSVQERQWIELLAAVPPPHGRMLPAWLGQVFDLDPFQIPGGSGLLTKSPGGTFKREIMRRAVLDLIPEFRLPALRSKLLTSLKDAGTDVFDHESWFKLAQEAGDEASVAHGAIAAARAAEARGDLLSCVGYLAAALPHALAIDPDLHAQITELWACRSAVSDGIADRTISTIARNVVHWTQLGNLHAAGTANLLLARLLAYQAEPAAARESAGKAIRTLEQAGKSPELAFAHALAAQLALTDADPIAAEKHLGSARHILPEGDGHSASIELDLIAAQLAAMQGDVGAVWDQLEAAHTAATAQALQELAVRIQIAGCDIGLANLNLDRAQAWASRESTLVTGPDTNCWKTALLGRQALVALDCGHLDEAVTLSEAALAGIAAPPAFAFSAMLAKAIAEWRMGEPGAAQALRNCTELADSLGHRSGSIVSRLCETECLILQRRKDEAVRRCEEATKLMGAYSDLACASLNAVWLHRLGSETRPTRRALFKAVEMELNGDASAAATTWLDSGYPYNASLSRLFEVGEAANVACARAFEELQAMHASGAAQFAAQLAADRGVMLAPHGRKRGPYHAARSHPLGLTRREVDILRMIVEGENNREIAVRLGRSMRTVEHHVSAILGKMGIESRVQAALYAVSHPEILEG